MVRASSREGFTIVELLVALAILAVVTSQVLGMFSSQLQTQVSQKRVLVAQEDSNLVADMIRRDVRMAGFMLPPVAGLSTLDGGNSAADTLCASDLSAVDPDNLDTATARFSGARLSAALGAGASTVSLVAADMDLDGDGSVDFGVGRGIILAQGTSTHCARITTVSPGSVIFTPSTPAGFSLTTGVAVPAVIYELAGSTLSRNSVALSNGVEDLQIEFGVDANDDGQIGAGEFPIHSLNGSDPTLIRTARLSVLTRTLRQEPNVTGAGRPGLANRDAAGANDAFRRRLVSVTAAPRNLFWGLP